MMRWMPVVVQCEDAGGGLVVTVGHPLVDGHLMTLSPVLVRYGHLASRDVTPRRRINWAVAFLLSATTVGACGDDADTAMDQPSW